MTFDVFSWCFMMFDDVLMMYLWCCMMFYVVWSCFMMFDVFWWFFWCLMMFWWCSKLWLHILTQKMHVKSLIVLMGHVWGHVCPKIKRQWSSSPCEVTWHCSLAHLNQTSFSWEAIVLTRAIILTRDFSVEIATRFFTKKREKKEFWGLMRFRVFYDFFDVLMMFDDILMMFDDVLMVCFWCLMKLFWCLMRFRMFYFVLMFDDVF